MTYNKKQDNREEVSNRKWAIEVRDEDRKYNKTEKCKETLA